MYSEQWLGCTTCGMWRTASSGWDVPHVECGVQRAVVGMYHMWNVVYREQWLGCTTCGMWCTTSSGWDIPHVECKEITLSVLGVTRYDVCAVFLPTS